MNRLGGAMGTVCYSRLAIAVSVLAVALLAIATARAPAAWRDRPADVHAYREAAVTLRQGGDPYPPDAVGPSGMRYLYPPSFLLLAGRGLAAPGTFALAGWAALQVLCLLAVGWLAWLGARAGGAGSPAALFGCVGLLFAPAIRNVVEGQINAIVMLALLGGWSLVHAGRGRTGGALLALAAHLKVMPVIALAVLLARRQWRAGAAMVLWLVLWVPLTGLWGSLSGSWTAGGPPVLALWTSWWRELALPAVADSNTWMLREFTPWNHSFTAALHRWFDPEVAAQFGPVDALVEIPRPVLRGVAWLAVLSLLGGSFQLARRRRGDPVVAWTALGCAACALQLGHAQHWTHHLWTFALFVPVWSAVANESRRIRRIAFFAALPYGVLFLLPMALAAALPQAEANAVYGVLFAAGRWGLPTLAIVALVVASGWLAWRRGSAEPSRAGGADAIEN